MERKFHFQLASLFCECIGIIIHEESYLNGSGNDNGDLVWKQ